MRVKRAQDSARLQIAHSIRRERVPSSLPHSTLIALDAQGRASVGFTQGPPLEGALLLQWLVFDGMGALVTSSSFAVNRDLF